jgi:hypothetical protein
MSKKAGAAGMLLSYGACIPDMFRQAVASPMAKSPPIAGVKPTKF